MEQYSNDILTILSRQRDQALNALAEVQAQLLAVQRELAVLKENTENPLEQ